MQTATTKTAIVSADELVKKMTIAAVEIYILGAEAGENEVCVFKGSIPLIEKAWELTDGQSAEALALIEKQRAAAENATVDSMESVLDEKLLLDTPSGKEILAVLWALIETAVRLDKREDRQMIVDLIGYLKDFWNLEEHIAF